jgi:frataxin-like iron-binding protein CyaY
MKFSHSKKRGGKGKERERRFAFHEGKWISSHMGDEFHDNISEHAYKGM